MFGREFQAGKHRQHIVPSPPTGYGFEVIGSRKEAGFYSVALPFRVETYEEGGRFYYDLVDADDVGLAWNEAQSEEERDQQIEQSVKDWGGNLADVEGWRPRKGASRRTAQWFTNTDRMGDSYKTTFDPSRGNEFQSDEPVARVSERPRSDGKPSRWSWEIWLPGGHPMGSGGVAPAVPEFGHEETEEEALRKAEQAMPRYAFRKASRRTAFLDTSKITWTEYTDPNMPDIVGSYPSSTYRIDVWGSDSQEGVWHWEVSEANSYSARRAGTAQSAGAAMEAGVNAFRELHEQVGIINSSRTADHHLAFFDTFDLPEPRHRVAGWDWDDHLNGFLAAEAAREFTCSCGASVPAPGYTDCRCGKRWNAYTIQANGSKKMIAREIPVRDGVVMAGRTASRAAAYEEEDGYTSPEAGDSIEVHSGGSYFEVLYDKKKGDHKFRATNGQEFYVNSIVSINGERINPDFIRLEASRKQADAFYPGDKVSFSPGGEQATVIRWDPAVGYVQIKWDDGQVESINEGMLVRASRKQAGELWVEDGDTSFFQYDSHAGEFYAEVYPASGSYTWFLSDPSGIRTYADGYGVATVEEAKAQAEQALTKVIGSEPVVAGRKQAESGVPKFREGDMVIGRGPDMNTHTLREVGSVVEQDGGYFYRLRKLNGSGPGGPRLYAEEHLEGYKLQR